MPQVINTNIFSLNAQRNLNNSQNDLQVALQRLSSGLRINSAKDDAAGLAITERFTAQIRGLNQAARNANDGISLSQTAEGALGEVSNNLQRIRELAVQSVNDTNSASDRQSLNEEVSQLIAEINRVASATEFNGQKVLDGSLSALVFQVGANQGQTISVNGVDARGSQLGAAVAEGSSINTSDFQTETDGPETLTIAGIDIDLSTAETDGVADVDALVNAINLVSSDSGVSARKAVSTSVELAYTDDADDARTLTINNVDIAIAAGATEADVVDAINGVTSQTGVTASGDGGGNITFENTSGADMSIGQDADPDDGGTDNEDLFAGLGPAAAGDAVTETFQAGLVLSADVGETPTVSSSGTIASLGLGSIAFTDNVLSNVNVLTGTNATDALATVDFALQQVSSLRAELGAVQNRFESTVANLQTSSENLSASRSRIQDADFAAETARLTQAQILQQAGIAVLAQANAQPQNVLALLQ